MTAETQFVSIEWNDRQVEIEHRWIGDPSSNQPLMIFLHEGLGSNSMWKDFPDRLCAAVGVKGLAFSRPAYGRSSPRLPEEQWQPDFMHRQAYEVLPAFLEAVNVRQPVWLFGHSDGGSIALLFASRFPNQVAGAVVLAPHLFVEDLTIASIEQARVAYQTTGLRSKLARYHDNPDSAFWGWNGIWLNPEFRSWNIEGCVHKIEASILAIQGLDDEYGTMKQVHAIAALVPATRVLALPDCGHSPHRDKANEVIAAVEQFMKVSCL